MEVIILPAEEEQKASKKTEDIELAIHALIGAVPYTDMSLEELREEQLGLMWMTSEKSVNTIPCAISI